MLIGWKESRTFFNINRCLRRKVKYQEKFNKLPYRGDWKLFTGISSFGNKQNFFKRMTALNTMSLVCHLSVRWFGTLSKCVFFSLDILFFSARPRRFGEKKVTRNIEKKAHGLMWNQDSDLGDWTPRAMADSLATVLECSRSVVKAQTIVKHTAHAVFVLNQLSTICLNSKFSNVDRQKRLRNTWVSALVGWVCPEVKPSQGTSYQDTLVTVQQKFFVSEKFRQKRQSGSSSGIYFRQTSDRWCCLQSFSSLAYRLSSHSWVFLITHLSFCGKFSQEFSLVKKLLWRKRRN